MLLRTILPLLAAASIVVFLLWYPQTPKPIPTADDFQAVDDAQLDAAHLDSASSIPSAPERKDASPSKLPDLETGAHILSVRVKNGQGHPFPKVPVSIWKLRSGTHSAWLLENTQANGVARFEMPPLEPGKDFTIVVGFAFPCGDAQSVRLLRSELPNGLVELNLASIGLVRIQLQDMEGANWRFPSEVSLVPDLGEDTPDPLSRFQVGHGYGHAKSHADGVVEFPCIGNQSSVFASVHKVDFGDWESQSFASPSENGKVAIKLQLQSEASMAHFRLLKPDGAPAALQTWDAQFRSFSIEGEAGSSAWTTQTSGTTDQEGFAKLPLYDRVNEGEWTKRVLLVQAKLTEQAPKLRAKVDILGISFVSGLNLGDVQLLPEEVLLAGHVLTEQGIPIEEVTMQVREIVQVTNVTRKQDFEESLDTRFLIKEDGAFELRGSHAPRKLKLSISAPGFIEKKITTTTGEVYLDIRLVASAVIEGQILGLSKELLEKTIVHFIPEGSRVVGYSKMGHVVSAQADSDGRFLLADFEAIKPGKVAVFVNRSDEALAEILEVTPWMSTDSPDSRLQPLQVRPLNRYLVSLVDTKGGPVKNAKHRVVPGKSLNPKVNIHFASSSSSSTYEFFDPREEVQVLFYHPDFQVVEAIVHPGDSTLVFEPPHTAKIEITNQLLLPEDFKLVVAVQSELDRGLIHDRIVIPADMPTFLENIPIPGAGTYRIYLELFDMTSFYDVHEVPWPGGEEFLSLEILNQPNQVIPFTFPTEQIQKEVDAILAGRHQ